MKIPPILLSYKNYMYWNKCTYVINYLYVVSLRLFGLITILYFITKELNIIDLIGT